MPELLCRKTVCIYTLWLRLFGVSHTLLLPELALNVARFVMSLFNNVFL